MFLKNKILPIILLFFIGISLSGCQPTWQIDLSDQSSFSSQIRSEDVAFYIENSADVVDEVPLGQLFYHAGLLWIDQVSLTLNDGKAVEFTWDKIADNAMISAEGVISIDGYVYSVRKIDLETSAMPADTLYSIMDIAPTVAYAMGLPELPESIGQVRVTRSGAWDQVVMILLDGFQFEKMQTMINDGLLPFLGQLDLMQKGVTVYPPITTSSTAAALTGTPPLINGVYGYGYRSTDVRTIFDLYAETERNVIAVEGASLSFNLRNTETILSGDRDGNGYSDDNVALNSLDIIRSRLPDLLYIHFHEIDDMGHSYGPESEQYESAAVRVDGYLEEIYAALPEKTFLIIFADHGMHSLEKGGNHGTLVPSDMIIPIVFFEK